MNTAVPGTRAGRVVSTVLARKSSSGTARAVRRAATSWRPVFQVVISVNSKRADDQREPAAVRDLEHVGAEEREVDRQEDAGHRVGDGRAATPSARCATTCSSTAVITIVSVTAMP